MSSQPSQTISNQLQRPSYFQGSDGRAAMTSIQSRMNNKEEKVSRPVMEALLAQKQQGKLSNSALEHWVNKFEDEYEIYYKHSSEEKQEDLSDVEAQFEALHKQAEDEYATKKFNSSVPQHTLLDSTIAKNKVKLSQKKSFSSKGKETFKEELKELGLTTNIPPQLEDTKPCYQYPAGKNPFKIKVSPYSSPRTGKKTQSSNVAREIKHYKHSQHESGPFMLGKEPDVTLNHKSKPKPSKKTEERKPKQQEFFPVAHLTKEEKSSLLEKHNIQDTIKAQKITSEDIDYEDITVFKKRTKKKRKNIPKAASQETNLIEPDETKILPCNIKIDKEIDIKEDNCVLDQLEPKQKVKGPKKPFESFQNCLFATFTTCVPWCMMKQIYWKKDDKSEELFAVTARRNSRTRIKMKYREHQL